MNKIVFNRTCFFGVDCSNTLAEEIKNSGLCLEEYLEIINKEILYIEKNKWPDNHILLDDHVKYAFRYSMIDNSYFPLKQTGKTSGEFDYVIIKENLLRLKTHIKNSLEQIR